MLKRSVLLLIGLGIFAAAAITFQRYEARQATVKAADLDAGFAKLEGEHAAENYNLRAAGAEKVLDIVNLLRQGYGTASPAELKGYIGDLQWAKDALPSDSPFQKPITRDIAWCQRQLKRAPAKATEETH